MKARMLSVAALVAALSVSACVYPTSTTTQGGVSSGLSFSSLPAGALVAVDGSVVGVARDYSGDKVLALPPGTHKVHVQFEGQTLVNRDYYVGRDSTVNVQAQ